MLCGKCSKYHKKYYTNAEGSLLLEVSKAHILDPLVSGWTSEACCTGWRFEDGRRIQNEEWRMNESFDGRVMRAKDQDKSGLFIKSITKNQTHNFKTKRAFLIIYILNTKHTIIPAKSKSSILFPLHFCGILDFFPNGCNFRCIQSWKIPWQMQRCNSPTLESRIQYKTNIMNRVRAAEPAQIRTYKGNLDKFLMEPIHGVMGRE